MSEKDKIQFYNNIETKIIPEETKSSDSETERVEFEYVSEDILSEGNNSENDEDINTENIKIENIKTEDIRTEDINTNDDYENTFYESDNNLTSLKDIKLETVDNHEGDQISLQSGRREISPSSECNPGAGDSPRRSTSKKKFVFAIGSMFMFLMFFGSLRSVF